eukprot:COSAG03_NODE_2217_length_2995_cov_2.175414_3_plen_90_part_00
MQAQHSRNMHGRWHINARTPPKPQDATPGRDTLQLVVIIGQCDALLVHAVRARARRAGGRRPEDELAGGGPGRVHRLATAGNGCTARSS